MQSVEYISLIYQQIDISCFVDDIMNIDMVRNPCYFFYHMSKHQVSKIWVTMSRSYINKLYWCTSRDEAWYMSKLHTNLKFRTTHTQKKWKERFTGFKIKLLFYHILNKIDMIISKELLWGYGLLVTQWTDSLGRDIHWIHPCFSVPTTWVLQKMLYCNSL